MHEFHCDYINNKYGNNSRLLFRDINSLMHKIKTENAYEDFSNYKEMFDFSNYQLSQNTMIIETNQWFIKGRMKQLVLRLKNYSYLVDGNSAHKKAKGMNRNIVATIIFGGFSKYF